jgi:RNA polymerase sigma-70 factor (ECF subfamily)
MHPAEQARAAAEAAARQSYGKLVAFLAARTRDVAAAEDALADAFAAALSRWPQSGVPRHPEAWLMTVARRRLIDAARRRKTSTAAAPELTRIAAELEAAAGEGRLPDERLGLMFACAHPAIEESVRAPLILQTILGFDAATIASAFLVSPAAMSQRLVRAKTRIRQAGIPLRIPEPAISANGSMPCSRPSTRRMPKAGSTRPAPRRSGAISLPKDLARTTDCRADAGRAGGAWLLALMLFAESRRPARRSCAGDYVPLAEQDTRLWDGALVAEAEATLRRASREGRAGRLPVEAAIQSAHAARHATGETDWPAIAALYDALAVLAPTPVVAINRAAAIGQAEGAARGLEALGQVADDPRMADYQPYWAARAGLLARLGHREEADRAYLRAIGLERDAAVRRFLEACRADLAIQSPAPRTAPSTDSARRRTG